MKRIQTLIMALLLFVLIAPEAGAQADCLTPSPDYDYLQKQGIIINHLQRNASAFTVKIFVHIINEDDGTGGVSLDELYTELDRLEAYYAPHDICFALMGVDFINDSDYASPAGDFDGNTADDLVVDYPPTDHVVNLYIIPDYTFFRGTAYAIPNYYLTIYAGRFNTAHLTHEMGHCLGLLHTHETSNGAELVDGSNCGSAGDLLCDTPADPALDGTNVSTPSCVYVGTDTDANGDSYMPDVTNTMSYAPFECRGSFTNNQEDRIKTHLMSNFFTVSHQVLLTATNVVVCCDDVSSGTYTEASLDRLTSYDYTVRDAANGTFLAGEEIILQPEFNADPNDFGSFLALINPFCDGEFPDGIPVGSSFADGTDILSYGSVPATNNSKTNEIDGDAGYPLELHCHPNPVSDQANIHFSIRESGQVQLTLYDSFGREVARILHQAFLPAGSHQRALDTGPLNPGWYLCVLQGPTGSQTIPLAIVR